MDIQVDDSRLPAEDLDEFLARMQVVRKPATKNAWDFVCSSTGTQLGRMYRIWGKTLQAVCKVHKDCTCMVEEEWFDVSVQEASLVLGRWICLGKFSNLAEHSAEAQKIVRSRRH